jgi:hypothetical protein
MKRLEVEWLPDAAIATASPGTPLPVRVVAVCAYNDDSNAGRQRLRP